MAWLGRIPSNTKQRLQGETSLLVENPDPIDLVTKSTIAVKSSVQAWYDKKKSLQRDEQTSIDSEIIKRFVHFAAAIYISLLLSVLGSEKMRITALGIVGPLLQISLVLLLPGLKRNVATSFAVRRIYIRTMSNIISWKLSLNERGCCVPERCTDVAHRTTVLPDTVTTVLHWVFPRRCG